MDGHENDKVQLANNMAVQRHGKTAARQLEDFSFTQCTSLFYRRLVGDKVGLTIVLLTAQRQFLETINHTASPTGNHYRHLQSANT